MKNQLLTMMFMVAILCINVFIIHIATNDYKASDDDKQL